MISLQLVLQSEEQLVSPWIGLLSLKKKTASKSVEKELNHEKNQPDQLQQRKLPKDIHSHYQ